MQNMSDQYKIDSNGLLLERGLTPLALNGDSSRYTKIMSAICEARNIFFTSNGFMGLGPDCAQEGDTLFVLLGGQTPFILRSLQ
jgi:hypothetical protein